MARTEPPCQHCRLPVPLGRIDGNREEQFCCAGCATVYAAIHDLGLHRFYELQDGSEAMVAAQPSQRDYRELDDPTFTELHVTEGPDGLRRIELTVEGLHCPACVWLLERCASRKGESGEIRVDFPRARIRVTWDPAKTSLGTLARRLDSLGYPVHPYREGAAEASARREDRALLIRMGICGAVAGNVMLIAFALYGGEAHGMEAQYERFFRWVSLGLTIPALLAGGTVFFKGAWAACRTRIPHMDLPIAIGILAGTLSGAVNTVTEQGPVYFESVTALIFLLLVGRYLVRRQQRRAHDATALLHSLTPRMARLIDGAAEREVTVESLQVGDRLRVRPGDLVPADGVVLKGRSSIDRSLLTGESRAEPVGEGDRVHAGTGNVSSPLEVEVQETGERTRIGQLMRLMEEEGRRRAPIVQLADRMAAVFVLVVLGLAGLTYGLWCLWDPSRAVDAAVALLIVTCPCALGLATPLAISAALGQAARRGILIKGGEILERLARPGQLWLDKTGTITEGRMGVTHWIGPRGLRDAVAGLEAGSSHPVARAFSVPDDVPDDDVPDDVSHSVEDVEETPGRGIRGRVDGRFLEVGSVEWARDRHGAFSMEVEEGIAKVLAAGSTPVVISSPRPLAVAGLGDRVRVDSGAVVAALGRAGWKVGILSGDHPKIVARVASDLGVPLELAEGGVSPERKIETVCREDGRRPHAGPRVMVGDGVNDAAALSAADVGIAVHGGAEAALIAGDVYLREEGLASLAELLEGSRRTARVIRRNLLLSLIYNVVGVSLAMSGAITPVVAAILMPLSSLTVVTSSYRAHLFGPRPRWRAAEDSVPRRTPVAVGGLS